MSLELKYESEGLCVLCDGVSHLGAPPLLFIDVSKGCFSRQTKGAHLEPTLRSNGEAPRAWGKGLTWNQPWDPMGRHHVHEVGSLVHGRWVGVVLSWLHALVGPLIHGRLNDAFWLAGEVLPWIESMFPYFYGCHVGPSILMLSRDWSVFCALDSKVCFPSILAQISA
jgi:hypothetical protein